MVVMQAVRHAVSAHGNATRHAHHAAHRIVQAALLEQAVVRRFVGQDEQAVLRHADHQHRQHSPRTEARRQGQTHRGGDDEQGLQQRQRRAPVAQLGQWRELGCAQHATRFGVA